MKILRFYIRLYLFTLLFIVSANNSVAQGIRFERVPIDFNSNGHREITDIDLDGFNDIACVNHNLTGTSSIVWYRYPAWERYEIVRISDYADYQRFRGDDIETGDIDLDGDTDIVGRIGLNNDEDGVICWFENPSKRNLSSDITWKRHDICETEYIKDFEVRDFNRDGIPDIAARSNTQLFLFFQSKKSWQSKTIPIHHLEGMEVADLDSDGDDDIILNGYWVENPADPLNQEWPEHNIDKKWHTQNTRNWQDNNCKVSVEDMNQDGWEDVLLANSEKPGYPISWYRNPGKSTSAGWIENVIGRIDKCHNLKVADFDLDGDPDVLAGTLPNIAGEYPHKFGIFINGGNALHWDWQLLTDEGNYIAQIGDIDNDGDMDIASLRNYNRPPIEIWRNLSAGTRVEKETSENTGVETTPLSLQKWHYIQVDNQRKRYGGRISGDGYWFGLAMGDLTGDGLPEIAAGNMVYVNPGSDLEMKWPRNALDDSLDILFILDVDDDEFGDVIAAKCNRQYWLEAKNKGCTEWDMHHIGSLPVCNHGSSSQGYTLAQIIPGGKQELLINANSLFCLIIPDNPLAGNWPYMMVVRENSNGEWISAGDIDADGDNDVCLFMRREDTRETEMNDVVWCENPGNGEEDWEQHHIGITEFHGDKVVPADINGDGRTDLVVTEERWPGMEPDASMFWYEAAKDPAYWNWKRYTIVTQFSMNNLDVADLDLDGDIDIVTCEHKGPLEELQIWENNGTGDFIPVVVDKGKESHAGARLSDLDRDGDMDIVSIAWNDFEYLHVWRNDAILGDNTGNAESLPLGYQLTGDYKYFIPVTVTAVQNNFTDKVVSVPIDLEQCRSAVNERSQIDAGSLRVIEVNKENIIIDESVVYQFISDSDSSHKGHILFMVKEGMRKGADRYFRLLYGSQGGYYLKPVFPKLVRLDEYIQFKGQQSFRVQNRNMILFYHNRGAGFAGLIDNDGNDWIGHRPGRGSGGEYRGIPNIRPAGFHPGSENSKTRLLHSGPLLVSWESETMDGKWSCLWEVYPGNATMTLVKKGKENYWLLYEGTPAGKLEAGKDYWVRSDGLKMRDSESWEGVLPDPEWVWFGDEDCGRVLFLAKHEYDELPDQFWQMQGNMIVFGFGRKPDDNPGTFLTNVPVHMTIGIIENTKTEQVLELIRSEVSKPLIVKGNPQAIK